MRCTTLLLSGTTVSRLDGVARERLAASGTVTFFTILISTAHACATANAQTAIKIKKRKQFPDFKYEVVIRASKDGSLVKSLNQFSDTDPEKTPVRVSVLEDMCVRCLLVNAFNEELRSDLSPPFLLSLACALPLALSRALSPRTRSLAHSHSLSRTRTRNHPHPPTPTHI